MRPAAAAICLAGLLGVAGCSGAPSTHAASTQPPAAQCARAQAVAGTIGQIARYFTGVTSTSGVVSADLSVASDSSITGSEASDLAHIAAAEAGAPSALAVPLRQLSADYQALQADNRSQPVSPSAIAKDATAAVADISKISSVCS